VRYAFILAWQVAFPIAVLCRVLGVSTSGFYAWTKRKTSARAKSDAVLTVVVKASHTKSRGTYGSPRVHADLRARGVRVGKKRVARLMRRDGLIARRKRRFRRTTDSNHSDPIAPNVLERRFTAEATNTRWVTDVTCLWTAQGWLFLAAMLDLHSRRVVGWATSASNDRDLALAALRAATKARKPKPGLVHHSDRGSPYASDDYRRELQRLGIVPSMSRKGNCWDNAVAESFFSTLKTELVDDVVYETHAEAAEAIREYIEGFYNVERRHSTLGYLSPIEFELKSQVAAFAA
jgi:transposase InsO family protein